MGLVYSSSCSAYGACVYVCELMCACMVLYTHSTYSTYVCGLYNSHVHKTWSCYTHRHRSDATQNQPTDVPTDMHCDERPIHIYTFNCLPRFFDVQFFFFAFLFFFSRFLFIIIIVFIHSLFRCRSFLLILIAHTNAYAVNVSMSVCPSVNMKWRDTDSNRH